MQNVIQNGFGDAFGAGQGIGGGNSQWGFVGGGGVSAQPISGTETAYVNLRWYLVSNYRQLLSELFVEIGLVQTVVTVPVDDGLRGGVMFKSKQLDEGEIKHLQFSMDRDNDLDTAGWAAKWARLYGGGGILILVDDQDPEEPLDLSSIGPDSKVEFRAVDMWELYWDKQNVEGYDAEIQQENFEFYNYYARPVHKSRVRAIKGLEAPSFIRPRLRGWGVSVAETLIRSMNQYLKATDLGFEVLDEFKLDVFKMKNLVNTLLSPNGKAAVQQRLQLANWQKNYQHALVMDSEDDFDHKQLSFAGLAEAMQGIRMQVAADMRMPGLKLFGQSFSTGGLGTSSSEEMENYNSMVESEVRNKLKWHILMMAEIKCQQLFGMIPDDLELEFKPLRELSAVDQETVKTAKFNRLIQAKAAGELTTLEFRDAANKGDLFDVHLDTLEDGLIQDPELEDVFTPADDAEGGENKNGQDEDKDEKKPGSVRKQDDDEPGADKPDTRKVAPKLSNSFKPYSLFESAARILNSAAFDRASYEADGGGSWIASGRKELFTKDEAKDKSLWARCQEESEGDWKFTVWLYRKLGGGFS